MRGEFPHSVIPSLADCIRHSPQLFSEVLSEHASLPRAPQSGAPVQSGGEAYNRRGHENQNTELACFCPFAVYSMYHGCSSLHGSQVSRYTVQWHDDSYQPHNCRIHCSLTHRFPANTLHGVGNGLTMMQLHVDVCKGVTDCGTKNHIKHVKNSYLHCSFPQCIHDYTYTCQTISHMTYYYRTPSNIL